jgi:hypothetical protein
MARAFVLAVVLLSVLSSSAANVTPAPAGATVPKSTPCPDVPNGTPTNSCFNQDGSTHVCCINPDSCGDKDAAGGATCAGGNYVIFNPPTFTLINGGATCPVCQGAPSNACFSSGGTQKVCCINPNSCSSTTPTCSNNAYVQFTGTPANPTAANC